jgi:hypothetical protein
MATTTPNFGWPVPTSTDYVKDGATAIEALGDAIDATVATISPALTLVASTTFSAQTAATLDNCFTSTYTNYLIKVNLTSISANQYLHYYYRSSAPADITTGYLSVYWAYYTGGSTAGSASDNLFIPQLGTAYGATSFTFNCDSPKSTGVKNMYGSIGLGTTAGSGQFVTGHTYTRNSAATEAAGIKFYPSAGNFSGTIRIYGVKN